MRSSVMKSVLPRSCAGAGTTADTDLSLSIGFICRGTVAGGVNLVFGFAVLRVRGRRGP